MNWHSFPERKKFHGMARFWANYYIHSLKLLTQPMDPEKKSLNFIFPTKYVIPKSLKFSHWLSETNSSPLKTGRNPKGNEKVFHPFSGVPPRFCFVSGSQNSKTLNEGDFGRIVLPLGFQPPLKQWVLI